MHDRFSASSAGGRQRDISGEASHWLARRDRGLTDAETRALQQWKAADPSHLEELERLEAAWRRFDLAKADPELVKMTRAIESTAARRRRTPRSVWIFAAATAACLAIAAGIASRPGAAPAVEKSRPEARFQLIASNSNRMTLPDGSVAELRGDSRIATDFTPSERRVRLLNGEVHFSVTKNPARPFIVHAGGVAVRAIGTAFNVRLAPDNVEVLVTEGTVRVAGSPPKSAASEAPSPAPVLNAGYRAVVTEGSAAGGTPPAIEVTPALPAEMEEALAWQSPRLIFNRTPLAEAVEAFNRYSSRTSGRLMLGDSVLQQREIGGTFRATNVDGFVRLLEQTSDVRVERRGDDIILLPVR